MIRARAVVFTFILVMMGYVLYHNERFLIQPSSLEWEHYGSIGWPLVLHGVAGACVALSLLWADIANNWSELGRAVRVPARSRRTLEEPATESA